MSQLKLSAFADEYDASFDEQLSALKDFGIENIHFWRNRKEAKSEKEGLQ